MRHVLVDKKHAYSRGCEDVNWNYQAQNRNRQVLCERGNERWVSIKSW